MDRIEKYVAQIYRTDLNGEITCISDGKEISMYFEGHNYDRTNESENYNKDSRMGE
jgi:competence protein ComEC